MFRNRVWWNDKNFLLLFFRTYINRPSSSWIDDYFDWANIRGCCKYFPANGSFCPHGDRNEICLECDIVKNDWNRPDAKSFSTFLPYFLQDNPDKDCSKAGHAAYSDVKSQTKIIARAQWLSIYLGVHAILWGAPIHRRVLWNLKQNFRRVNL